MPKAKEIVRECPRCVVSRPVSEFRDVGDVRRGRPPKVCRFCRAKDPALQERQVRNVGRRPLAVRKQRSYASRTPDEVREATRATYRDGRKTCPSLSGCGRSLSVSAFGVDPYQADGLTSVCATCD